MPQTTYRPVWKVVVGCFGGLFIHMIVGSLYQWGIINIYFTSFYKITEPSLKLENTGVVFPIMMTCIGIGMRPGIHIAERIGTFWTLLAIEFAAALIVLASSFIPTFIGFVAVFGASFGVVTGMSFMLPMIECNKYMPGKRMYINGVILVGMGMSSVIFGQFSYNFLNPEKIPSNFGYYDGNLQYIAKKVPECLRYLSLQYIVIGLIGCFMLLPVIQANHQQQKLQRKPKNPLQADISKGLLDTHDQSSNQLAAPSGQATVVKAMPIVQQHPKHIDCPSYTAAFKSTICWMLALCIVLGSCGDLILNGNYKTYVKRQITDDEYLTLIGTVGAIGNGFTRFFWNMLFNKIDFRPVMAIIILINVGTFAAVNFTVHIRQLYCFMIFLANSCLGALFVVMPTVCLQIYGSVIGAGIYSFYWMCFALANFIGYLYVSQLSPLIGLPNVLYIAVGMAASVLLILIFFKFQPKWTEPKKQSIVIKT